MSAREARKCGISIFAEKDPAPSPVLHPLRLMDLCSGAGGLSNRLEQAGVARACWAVENCPSAAEAFRLNHPQATVYLEDCSNLLERIVEGRERPCNGEVEIIVGGPPCQGFSQLNHHRGTYGECQDAGFP